MACGATLKRSREFDSLHSPGRSPKRICGELISSPKPQCPNYSHPASFVEAAQKLANGEKMYQTSLELFGTLEDDRTVLYKAKSLDGTNPNTNPNPNPNTNAIQFYPFFLAPSQTSPELF